MGETFWNRTSHLPLHLQTPTSTNMEDAPCLSCLPFIHLLGNPEHGLNFLSPPPLSSKEKSTPWNASSLIKALLPADNSASNGRAIPHQKTPGNLFPILLMPNTSSEHIKFDEKMSLPLQTALDNDHHAAQPHLCWNGLCICLGLPFPYFSYLLTYPPCSNFFLPFQMPAGHHVHLAVHHLLPRLAILHKCLGKHWMGKLLWLVFKSLVWSSLFALLGGNWTRTGLCNPSNPHNHNRNWSRLVACGCTEWLWSVMTSLC